MHMRVGTSRAILITASLLVFASGAAVAGNGVAAASTVSPAHGSRAAHQAVPLAVNTIKITNPPGNQVITALPAAVTLSAAATDDSVTPVTLNYAASALPPGVAISATTGAITGTITAAYTGSTTVTVTDGTGATATDTFTWAAADTITVTAPANQATAVNTTIAPLQIAAATTGTGQTLAYAATGLPAGLAIAPGTGLISGTTGAAAGTSNVTVSVTDGTGSPAGTAAFTWSVNLNTITLTTPANRSTPPNTLVSLQVAAADSAAGQPLTFAATGLPTGLKIAPATGLISGTTSAAAANLGVHTVTITVTNPTSTTATGTFAWSIALNKITVTAPLTEQSIVGVAARLKITAKDAAAGQKLTYTAVNLPPGLKIAPATGLITGTPGALFAKATTVTATDRTGSSGAAVIRWQVGGLINVPDPGGQVLFLGQPVDIPLTVRSNVARDTVTLKVAGLPAGVGFTHKPLVLSGWPEKARTYNVTLTARGDDGGVTIVKFPVRVRPARNTGPKGALALDVAGKCLDDPGNRSANGTRVDIWSCNGGAAQQWTMAEDGTIRIHGKCMQVVSGSVRLEGCTAAPAQTWVKGTDAELVNPASGRCLADPGSSTANGTRPGLAPCTAKRGELWAAPGGPLFAGMMGSCADDHFSSGANGNVIDVFACNGSAAQSWQVRTDGTLRIFGNKCMTVAGGAGRIGAKIELFTCAAGAASQHWQIVAHGTFVAAIKNGGGCLAVPSNTSPAGTQLRLERCPGTVPGGGWHDW